MSKKRNLEDFFTPNVPKKARLDIEPIASGAKPSETEIETSNHPHYPFPVPYLPLYITTELAEPYVPGSIERDLFEFLRRELFLYRVQYTIKRYGTETQINTPRFTTVFGVDTASQFTEDGKLIDSQTLRPVPADRYRVCAPRTPRPLPQCLDTLRRLTEVFTGATYNFCHVNYYANGGDSISYHSDDERFLGPNPSIASFSLGATRDFCMKHKPIPHKDGEPPPEQNLEPSLKLPLASGDMMLMRGTTQSQWLHSIPKRKGKGSEGGRINITFRKGVEKYSTQNYYQYNVGEGEVWKWDEKRREMMAWPRS